MGKLRETKEKQCIKAFKRYISKRYKHTNYTLYKEILSDFKAYTVGGFHYLEPTSPLLKHLRYIK